MSVILFDGGLRISVFFDESDRDFDDDICIQFIEKCPEDEKVMRFDETNIYVTPDQACLLVLALQRAMDSYRESNQDR